MLFLHQEIEHGQRQQQRQNEKEHVLHQRLQQFFLAVDIADRGIVENIGHAATHDEIEHGRDHGDLQRRQQRFQQRFQRKDLAGVFHRVDLVDVRLDRMGGKQHAELHDAPQHRHDELDQDDRQQDPVEGHPEHDGGSLPQGAVERQAVDELRHVEQLRQMVEQRFPAEPEIDHDAQQHEEGDHLLALGDLPLLSRVAKFLRRRRFRLSALVVTHRRILSRICTTEPNSRNLMWIYLTI